MKARIFQHICPRLIVLMALVIGLLVATTFAIGLCSNSHEEVEAISQPLNLGCSYALLWPIVNGVRIECQFWTSRSVMGICSHLEPCQAYTRWLGACEGHIEGDSGGPSHPRRSHGRPASF